MIDDESLRNLEKLHQLKNDGVITEADFDQAKKRVLRAPASRPSRPSIAMPATFDGTLPAENDHFAWIALPLRRYADFNGRSRRKEFWLFTLVYVALFLVSAILAGLAPDLGIAIFLLGALGLFFPHLALQVRRFHDQDKSGWFALFHLLPYLGSLIVLVFMAIDGTRGDNQFGQDPKRP